METLYSVLGFEWIDGRSILIFLCVFLLLSDIWKYRVPKNFPPGPWALPFLGDIHRIRPDRIHLHSHVSSHSPKTFYPVPYKMYINAETSLLVIQYNILIGIALSNGYLWKKQRKFANTHLRYFGEGQKSLEKYIEVECSFLCEAFKEEQGRPFNPHYIMTNAIGNIIFSVVFGHRFEYSDPSFRRILELDNDAVVLAGSAQTQLYDAFPGLMKYLPGPHQTVHANYREIVAFLNREIEKHQEEWNPDDPRDFTDAYLSEMEKKKEDPRAGFNIETLLVCTLDLIEAGTESASTTLRWALVFMMNYPEIQEKVQAEIDRVVGQSRLPTLADRPNLPYTDAVIHETQRFGNIVPLGFPKMANKDSTLGGYFIPKGTAVTTILSSVLFDKNEWETPDVFNPEHFLDSEGKFRRRDAFFLACVMFRFSSCPVSQILFSCVLQVCPLYPNLLLLCTYFSASPSLLCGVGFSSCLLEFHVSMSLVS
uniref:Cytochrome P450, family 2, subfamily AD, polypeptide 2 n=1 Tax=Neolamprologus brichardi TaxID=32507 RepID=A0A3Q4IFA0_NEOBR